MVSCQKEEDPVVDCTGLVPTYTTDIKAILDESCSKSGCHNAASHLNGINLSSYAGAKSISGEDRFLGAIRHKKGFTPMPESSPKLSDDKLNLIACWVENGAPE